MKPANLQLNSPLSLARTGVGPVMPIADTASDSLITPHTVVLAASAWFAVWVCFLVAQFFTGATLFPYLGGDFAQFYIAGKILNTHGASSLYDVELHSRMFRELHRVSESASLWYVYSPTLAILFRPLSLLPFKAAYAVWCCAAILLYVDGLRSIRPFLADVPNAHRRALFALAFSFLPFVGWSLIGGQISVIAFALLARAIRLDLQGSCFMAGAVLSLCAYKPTMLVVIGPCLVARGNWRLIAGFAGGVVTSFAIVCATAGISVITDWVSLLLTYVRFAGGAATPWPQNWPNLIDLNHFFQRLAPNTIGAKVAFAIVAAPAVLVLLSKWRKCERMTREMQTLLWAGTVTGTLLVNAYAMAYDAVLMTGSILLTFGVAYRHNHQIDLGRGKLWAWSVYGTALLPAVVVRVTNVHVFTIALCGWMFWQLTTLSRMERSHDVTAL